MASSIDNQGTKRIFKGKAIEKEASELFALAGFTPGDYGHPHIKVIHYKEYFRYEISIKDV